ncbi:hypothetical protein RGR602_CH03097 [Rhizobium gallicum bv. gallicum R602sp]|uniref:Uncharacterized protein n=1 Tax=Rhizobium gallicum bv. gallicum R602sp TaxID=1041138 RepID=A0A0B4X2S3_9HYPH|nr:hypothetical protein [Rhizobium gallicum]AJD42414.1 hypothetical protein RGR602_CH03097 [Rhizobium gallicum bv. gallicum R602sp]
MATRWRSTIEAETHRHAAESYVLAPNAGDFLEQMSLPISKLARMAIGNGAERILFFDEGKAIVRAFEGGLLLWVGASNLVIRHALQLLLEGGLFHATSDERLVISWYLSVGKPFAVIEGLLFATSRDGARCNTHLR